MASGAEIPLFPLQTVLFPGGPLPLRIFEPRYLGMVSRCLREKQVFGVVLIRRGSDVGEAETYDVGTTAEIVDWYRGSDGLLGLTAEGRQRFRLSATRRRKDGLYVGRSELLPPEPAMPVPEQYEPMARLLRDVLDKLGSHYRNIAKDYEDASWVGYRLAEILPLSHQTKQSLLELDDARRRLELLRPSLEEGD